LATNDDSAIHWIGRWHCKWVFRNWWSNCHSACLDFFHGHGPTQSPRHFFGFTPLAGRVFGLLGILSQWQRRCSVGVVNCVWVVCWSVFGCLLCTMAAITGHAKIFRRFLDSDWAENVVAVRALL